MRRCLPLLLVFLSAFTFAQSTTGSVRGTVRDSQGALVASAAVRLRALSVNFSRTTLTNRSGEFQFPDVPADTYSLTIEHPGFERYETSVKVAVSSSPSVEAVLHPATVRQSISVTGIPSSITDAPIETASSTLGASIGREDLEDVPLAHRSFANIAYLAPMTAPVEPSDPTKARITAVSFGGSSGLNVDLSVDGGDNNDDFIGGFLQNYSPDAIQEFNVRTALFEADTSRTNGGSVIIGTRRGTDLWHGDLAAYFRDTALNARSSLDNPAPDPKQPFSRQNIIGALGGPIVKQKLWFFSSLEWVHEDASIAYSPFSLREFRALSQLASANLLSPLPNGDGVTSIDVPLSASVPFQNVIFDARVDWRQSDRATWFVRGSFDRNRTENDLVRQGTLPSTGATTDSDYTSVLLSNQYEFAPNWIGSLILQGSWFDHTKRRNSQLGFALAFPFSTNFHTTSGFETFGDNQFVTELTAFPIQRDQQKYQYRYDVSHVASSHTVKLGINFIHEPVLRGAVTGTAETLYILPADPTFYVSNPPQFTADLNDPGNQTVVPARNGVFSQSVKRVGMYVQDTWRVTPNFTVNYGVRYDTTLGFFIASGRDQNFNPAVLTVRTKGIPLPPGIPHDYRLAIAPRVGIAYSPGASGRTVFRAGVGTYYNDLTQNGWVDAFLAVNQTPKALLGAGEQGALIDPNYHTPYTIQAMAGLEHEFRPDWFVTAQYVHQQGVHEYRRYEYVGGVTLFNADGTPAPNLSVFKTDNRSRYDGASLIVRHRLTHNLEFTAHYTFAHATTWGAVVGELFDFVNGVSDVRNPFGPGDSGPSGEDIRHRLVLIGTGRLPGNFEISTLAQFESARPFTLAMPVDVNHDGLDNNDRAVINGVPTKLDQFRGVPFAQVDLRIAREFRIKDRASLRPFVEFFNLFNRQNAGNNFVGDVGALAPPSEVASGNITHVCLVADCSKVAPITSLDQLKLPAGALGDFFGPGTTVGIPFAAQFGVRFSF